MKELLYQPELMFSGPCYFYRLVICRARRHHRTFILNLPRVFVSACAFVLDSFFRSECSHYLTFFWGFLWVAYFQLWDTFSFCHSTHITVRPNIFCELHTSGKDSKIYGVYCIFAIFCLASVKACSMNLNGFLSSPCTLLLATEPCTEFC